MPPVLRLTSGRLVSKLLSLPVSGQFSKDAGREFHRRPERVAMAPASSP
jgi:hypothetical protein